MTEIEFTCTYRSFAKWNGGQLTNIRVHFFTNIQIRIFNQTENGYFVSLLKSKNGLLI